MHYRLVRNLKIKQEIAIVKKNKKANISIIIS